MADSGASSAAVESAAPVFKKKAPRNRDVRQRPAEASTSGTTAASAAGTAEPGASSRVGSGEGGADDDGGGGPARSEVVLKRKAPSASNALVSRTEGAASLASKRQRFHSPGAGSDGEDEYGALGAVDRFGERTLHSSSHAAAVRSGDYPGDGDEDGPASSKSGPKLSKDDPEAADDGLYKGLSAYKSHAPTPRDDGSSSKVRARGPIKASTTIRTVSVVDYQPDVCKDYKETGYCGFGDTCKFLHDRSDYLAGWQLALVPEAFSGGKRRDDVSLGLLNGGELDEEDEEIPFACLICRQPFTEPVVTRCGHYFCMACAVKRYAKNPKCFACGKPTQGLFNSATKILERMEKKREAKAETLRERREAWGQEGEVQTSGEILEGVEIG